MKTYAVQMVGRFTYGPGHFNTDPLSSRTYPEIEARSVHDAIEAAMFLYELDEPFNERCHHWQAFVDGVEYRLFWFIEWNPITLTQKDYIRGATAFDSIRRTPPREEG